MSYMLINNVLIGTCHLHAIEISCILTHQIILDRCMEILYIFSGMLVLDMIISILNKGRLYVSLNVLF